MMSLEWSFPAKIWIDAGLKDQYSTVHVLLEQLIKQCFEKTKSWRPVVPCSFEYFVLKGSRHTQTIELSDISIVDYYIILSL